MDVATLVLRPRLPSSPQSPALLTYGAQVSVDSFQDCHFPWRLKHPTVPWGDLAESLGITAQELVLLYYSRLVLTHTLRTLNASGSHIC